MGLRSDKHRGEKPADDCCNLTEYLLFLQGSSRLPLDPRRALHAARVEEVIKSLGWDGVPVLTLLPSVNNLISLFSEGYTLGLFTGLPNMLVPCVLICMGYRSQPVLHQVRRVAPVRRHFH